MSPNSRVLVAMSGGVDSSVAALLLKDQGYDVVGAHLKLWDYAEAGKDDHSTLDSLADCRSVCERIGAPLQVLNLSELFRQKVIEDFVGEYRAGRTPNPCVRCNFEVKWHGLLQKAVELGCDRIATGHYSFVEQGDSGRWRIRKGVDHTRDQSYVLWGLSQTALSHTLMPLGGLTKSDVREIARKHGLRTADRTESREICFIADDDYRRFLHEYAEKHDLEFHPGDIVHADGRVLGQHGGTEFFTIGQRRGLGISQPTPLYVQKIDPESHRVVVGEDEDLYAGELTAAQVNWVALVPPSDAGAANVAGGPGARSIECEAKIRYLHQAAPASLTPLTSSSVRVTFRERQRAITPGQSVVFYDGDIVLGGGVIE